jgi:hypothetical protein
MNMTATLRGHWSSVPGAVGRRDELNRPWLVRDTLDVRGFRAQGTRITNRMNGKLNVDKGTNMKSPLIVASAVVLFVMAGVAHSQGTPQASQPAPQENAATQAADPSAGMEAYGGTPDSRVQGGAKDARPCRVDPQCNVFFGGN